MEISKHLSSAELKRQIEAMKKEVARKEKKLKWLERVSKNRSSTIVSEHTKRKYCDELQKEESLSSRNNEYQKEKFQATDGIVYSNTSEKCFKSNEHVKKDTHVNKTNFLKVDGDTHLKKNEYFHVLDHNTCMNKISPIETVSEEHLKNDEYICNESVSSDVLASHMINNDKQFINKEYSYAHDQNTRINKVLSNMIVPIKDTKRTDDTDILIKDNCDSMTYDEMCTPNISGEQENIINEMSKESILNISSTELISKKCFSEYNQTKKKVFSEERIHSTNTSLSNMNVSLRRSIRLAKCKQGLDSVADHINLSGYNIDKGYCETISNSLSTSTISPNEIQDQSSVCLKNIFSILEDITRNLSNSSFVLPDEEYASLKLQILTEKSFSEKQNVCKQKAIKKVSEKANDNNQKVNELSVENRISKTIDDVTDHAEFSDRQQCKTLISDLSLGLEKDTENILYVSDTESSIARPECAKSYLISTPKTSKFKSSPCSLYTNMFLSQYGKVENTLQSIPRFEKFEENVGVNNKTIPSHSEENSPEMTDVEERKTDKENNKQTTMKLIFSLKVDITERVEKINSYFIPQEQQYVLIQHITKVSIWNQKNLTWLYCYTFIADIDEKVLDSCLLHQNSSLYFAVALSNVDSCILNIYTFDPKLKCLEKFYSQTNAFHRLKFCKLEDKTFAAAYSMPNTSTIHVYNIQETTKDECITCISHLLASVDDCITSLLVVDNLPQALLCCGRQYLYIWNGLTHKLIRKIYMEEEIPTSNCYQAYALKGLLFLMMIRNLELEQKIEPSLIVFNPATSKYKILRTYGSLKNHQKYQRSLSARGFYICILDDYRLTIYNIFTAREIAYVEECKLVSFITINKSCIVMVGFDDGAIHCYQFV